MLKHVRYLLHLVEDFGGEESFPGARLAHKGQPVRFGVGVLHGSDEPDGYLGQMFQLAIPQKLKGREGFLD